MVPVLLTTTNSFGQDIRGGYPGLRNVPSIGGMTACPQFIRQNLGLRTPQIYLDIAANGKLKVQQEVRSTIDAVPATAGGTEFTDIQVKTNDEISVRTNMTTSHMNAKGLVKIFTDNQARIKAIQYLYYQDDLDFNTLQGPEFLFSYDKDGNCRPEKRQSVSFRTGRTVEGIQFDRTGNSGVR